MKEEGIRKPRYRRWSRDRYGLSRDRSTARSSNSRANTKRTGRTHPGPGPKNTPANTFGRKSSGSRASSRSRSTTRRIGSTTIPTDYWNSCRPDLRKAGFRWDRAPDRSGTKTSRARPLNRPTRYRRRRRRGWRSASRGRSSGYGGSKNRRRRGFDRPG